MKLAKSFAVLVGIEGILAFLWAFLTPSESKKIIFLWFSLPEIMVLLGIAASCLASFGIIIRLFRSKTGAEAIEKLLDQWLLEKKRLASFVIVLFVMPVLLLTVVLKINSISLNSDAYQTWAPITFPVLYALVHRTLPLVFLGIVVALELGILIVVRYSTIIVQRETWAWQNMETTILWILLVTATMSHWVILAFQLRFFVNIPAWYWAIKAVPFKVSDIWFVLPVIFGVILSYWVLIIKKRIVIGLSLVFLTGWFLQMGIGIMAGGGADVLRDRYFSTAHAAYPVNASYTDLDIWENIKNYENLYANRLFTNTKPPGLMAFYISLEHFINGNSAEYTKKERYERFSWTITYIFPVFSMLMIFLIYAFSKRFGGSRSNLTPLMAPLLYIFCPNIISFSLFADQALYPLAFLIGVWFIITTIQRRSMLLAFFLGIFLYCAIFFAFTMLPLYLFACIYLILDYLFNKKDHLSTPIKLAGTIALGTISSYFMFLVFLNYNFFSRFAKTVQINHNFDFYLRVGQHLPTGPESLQTRMAQVANAAWINNLDFSAAIGFAIYILFVAQSIRLIAKMVKGGASSNDLILLSLLFSFIALNLAGTAQGEVARLWMFWTPMVVISASREIEKLIQNRTYLFLFLILIQFITIVLVYHFQDLKM